MDNLNNFETEALVDNITDMYIPIADLENLTYEAFCDINDEKHLSNNCEEIVSELLNMITILMKKTTYDRCKDILKHYFNRYRELEFSHGNIEEFPTLESKLQKHFMDVDIEEILKKITTKMKILHELMCEYNIKMTLINMTMYCTSLKKIDSCISAIIFTLKLDEKMKSIVYELENLHSKISV